MKCPLTNNEKIILNLEKNVTRIKSFVNSSWFIVCNDIFFRKYLSNSIEERARYIEPIWLS